MIVSHYNTYAEGGAAVLMRRLHAALRAEGVESRMRYRAGRIEGEAAKQMDSCVSGAARLQERVMHKLETLILKPDALSYFSRLSAPQPTPPDADDHDIDVVHLHWVGRWLDLPSFLDGLAVHIPVVWTIHDMSSLAGGCFTYSGCDRFADGCRRCPLLRAPFDRFVAAHDFQCRLRALNKHRVFVVGNSDFTTGLARRSGLFARAEKIVTILPAVSASEFVRHDKAEAKRLLGIDSERFILGFGAASLTDENKGIDRFFDVAAALANSRDDVDVLIFGDGDPSCPFDGFRVHRLGKLSSPEQLSIAMSAMDVLIVTSRMETFGQVAVEAQACGTPVWAYDVGGLRDAVDSGVTGRLIPYGNTSLMARSICECVARGELAGMGLQAASWVRRQFMVESMAAQYHELYREAARPPLTGRRLSTGSRATGG